MSSDKGYNSLPLANNQADTNTLGSLLVKLSEQSPRSQLGFSLDIVSPAALFHASYHTFSVHHYNKQPYSLVSPDQAC